MFGEGEALSRLQWPARLVGYAFIFVACLGITLNLAKPFMIDFISYWAAAVLALDGNALGAWDIDLHKAVQESVVEFDGLMPFPYPPPFLALLLPFGLLGFPAASGLWIALTFIAYGIAGKHFAPRAGWLLAAFPPVIINAIIGQNGLLTAAIFLGGLVLLPKRPFLAGALLGCLIIKPHLGLLLPFVFIAGGQWRAFLGAAVSVPALLLAGLLAFGPASYVAWIEQAPLYASIVAEGLVGWHKMASLYAALSLAGLPSALAWTVHLAVAASAAVAACLLWRRNPDAGARGAVLATATVLGSPYLYTYDLVILVVPFLWLARSERNWPVLGPLWALLLVNVIQNCGFAKGFNLTPLVPLGLMFLLIREADWFRNRLGAGSDDGADRAAWEPRPAEATSP